MVAKNVYVLWKVESALRWNLSYKFVIVGLFREEEKKKKAAVWNSFEKSWVVLFGGACCRWWAALSTACGGVAGGQRPKMKSLEPNGGGK